MRPSGRNKPERNDGPETVAVGRRRHLADGLAIAQDQFSAMRERRIGSQADKTEQPLCGRLAFAATKRIAAEKIALVELDRKAQAPPRMA